MIRQGCPRWRAVCDPFSMVKTAKKSRQRDQGRLRLPRSAPLNPCFLNSRELMKCRHGHQLAQAIRVRRPCGSRRHAARPGWKVIPETGEPGTPPIKCGGQRYRHVCRCRFHQNLHAKFNRRPLFPVTLVMPEAIRDFYYKTGRQVGMKPAGGISKSKLALHHLVMLKEVLGEQWMNNH